MRSPHPKKRVESLSEVSELTPCDSCWQLAEGLLNHAGDRLCGKCRAVLGTAAVLFQNEITDETEIISTMAFAAYAYAGTEEWPPVDEGLSEDLVKKYPRFEIRVVDGVPILRLRLAVVSVIRYASSKVPRKVLIEVFSRFAEPDTVAELYERTLVKEGIHFNEYSGGTIELNTENARLSILVGAKRELDAARVGHYSEYPRGRFYSFPPPNLVREIYKALLGSVDKRTFAGYAYGLGDHGRTNSKTAEKTISACAAWYAGEYVMEQDGPNKPAERRPRVARVLNRYLLRPLGKPELPEDHWRNEDTIWRDAREVSQRLMRTEYFLQRSVYS
jgi:hypothetical protein